MMTPASLFLLCVLTLAPPDARADQYDADASFPQARTANSKSDHVPELQVGCADGLVPDPKKAFLDTKAKLKNAKYDHKIKNKLVKYEGDDDLTIDQIKSLDNPKKLSISHRKKRQTIRWYGSSSVQQATTHRQYTNYKLVSSVPYWIPIWGNPSRIPIYFPAKPILFNPGYPVRNPPDSKPYPPAVTTEDPTITPEGNKVVIGNRINVEQDPNLIWGIVESSEVSSGGASAPKPSITRPTKPPTPPLFHNPGNQISNPQNSGSPQQQVPPVFTTTLPPAVASSPSGPNRCVWAIISCCNPTSTQIRYNCFEQLGCPGAFWDNNPCSREVTTAALNAAQMFYDQTSS